MFFQIISILLFTCITKITSKKYLTINKYLTIKCITRDDEGVKQTLSFWEQRPPWGPRPWAEESQGCREEERRRSERNGNNRKEKWVCGHREVGFHLMKRGWYARGGPNFELIILYLTSSVLDWRGKIL